jgi:type I restriction enzyme S subunit
VGLSLHDGMITGAYTVFESLGRGSSEYFELFYRAMDDRKLLSPLYSGLRNTIPVERFLGTKTPQPPPAEQAAIVRFLDWTNGRLERAIRAKRKVIALLNEQKQAIIHRAVTRGLDPSVPLRPSGIPWLGDIPQHWEVSRVKNEFCCLNTRRVPLNSVERGAMTSKIYDYYGASGVIDKVDAYLFDDELLLIAEDGANLVLRNLPLAIIARGKFWVNNHAHILKPKRGSIVYLAHLLETLNYAAWISGAAQPKLTQDRLLSISIAVPPTEEQETIVLHTSEQTRPLVTAISRLEREIEFLREYRTRLVADVVTGKLDVREAAAQLPDEAPPDTAEDDTDLSDETESVDEEAVA